MLRQNFLALLLLSLTLTSPAYAQLVQEFGPATTYEVTLKKVELCAQGSAIDLTGTAQPTCLSPFVLGNETEAFDIASASVGAAIGGYGDFSSPPAGTTYTHARMTLSRTFTLAGLLAGSGCRTDSSGTPGNAGNAAIGTHDGAPGTAQTMVIVDTNAFAPGTPSDQDYWQNGLVLNGADFTFTAELPQPFVATGTLPTIRVAFNTQQGLGGMFNGGVCLLYPGYPSVTLSTQ